MPSRASEDTPLLFDGGQDGRANRYVPPAPPAADLLPAALLRDDLPLPDHTELNRLIKMEMEGSVG